MERSVSSTESNLDGNINLKDTPVLHVSSFEVVHAVKFLLRQAIKCSPPGTTVSFRSFLKFHETNPSVRNAVTAVTAVDDVEGVGGGGSAGQVSSIPGSDSPRVRPSRIAPEPLFESESESGRGTDPNRVASNVSNKRLDSLRLSIGSAVSTVSALRKSLLGSISSRSSAISGRSRHRPPAPSRVLVRDPERGDLWLEETGRLVLEVTDKGMGMSAVSDTPEDLCVCVCARVGDVFVCCRCCCFLCMCNVKGPFTNSQTKSEQIKMCYSLNRNFVEL